MGSYAAGDVVLAPIRFPDGGQKIRPAVVVAVREDGSLIACPVSSKPPSDMPSMPLSLPDFARGGLDLLDESYVLARPCTLRSPEVVAKKGRLTAGALAAVAMMAQNGRNRR